MKQPVVFLPKSASKENKMLEQNGLTHQIAAEIFVLLSKEPSEQHEAIQLSNFRNSSHVLTKIAGRSPYFCLSQKDYKD